MPAFSWLNFGQAKAELATRLNDPTFVFTANAEAGLYLTLALRMWNAFTAYFVAEYPVTLEPPFTQNWFQANGSGSPREQTQTDISLFTQMQYMLLEPPTGGTWTGTPMFNIPSFSQAVQGRRDECLQHGATNLVEIPSLALTPGTSRVFLPDNVLDVLRVRYVPQSGNPSVLQRGDAESFRTFTPAYLQTTTTPLRWDVISGPPLALTLDANVPTAATLQVLTMQSEGIPDPPAATPLGIPDDWTWVPLFGALYDLLNQQEESLDLPRAKYCLQRYEQGLEMLRKAPWLLEGRVNNVAMDTSSLIASDRFNFNWQTNVAAYPQIVVAGTDLYAVAPVPVIDKAVTLVLIANAPIPATDADFIQVPRDVMDAILDEAEHLAQFKRGGAEFLASVDLHNSFLATAARWERRVGMSGIFPTTLRNQVPKNQLQQPRFALAAKES